MTEPSSTPSANRREFLMQSGALAAGATALANQTLANQAPLVHTGGDSTIHLALIGCGGRGTGAVGDALSVADAGPIKLHVQADLDEKKMKGAHDVLKRKFPDKVDVSDDRRFTGFGAYREAIDSLSPGDIALCTTRAYIRPVHVEYAVSKGINVFMEKPFACDPGGLQRMLRAGEEADRKGVKIAAGLQCRHSPARQALIQEIREGVMGDIHLIRANRLGGGRRLNDQGANATKLTSQLQFGRTHLYWIGSGHMVDYLIHQIDECCWLKDSWPISCEGLGGRVPHSNDKGQNIDVYSMEYTFADGAKAFCDFGRIDETRSDFATYVHGTKSAAQFSGNIHAATVHRYKDQRIAKDNIAWTPTKDAVSPWQYEWDDFIHSIRNDLPHNEAKRAVYSDFATLMGRAACHTGQTVTWEQITASNFQFCDYLDDLDYDSPVPVTPDENGQFPVPVPGKWTEI
ncbi:MAG: Gfo/Idh/MocA family protein [Aeoliella sp.]